MPRYRYKCSRCEISKVVFHMISEIIDNCDECDGIDTMKKLVSTPHIKKEVVLDENEVGDITKEYIEANREILEQQQQSAKEDTYEPS